MHPSPFVCFALSAEHVSTTIAPSSHSEPELDQSQTAHKGRRRSSFTERKQLLLTRAFSSSSYGPSSRTLVSCFQTVLGAKHLLKLSR